MASGQASTWASSAPTVRDLLASGRPTVSFEFFPPKDEAGETTLWRAIRELEPLAPSFVSVTYGAGGSTRERTVRVTERIAADTTLTPVAHLTCQAHTRAELRTIVGRYADAGVRNVLALRGDPAPGTLDRPAADDLPHAVDLVRLVRGLGDFCVGVAAFPAGHPDAPSLDADTGVLAAKATAGADFAITQLFFDAADYRALVERVRAVGCALPVIPGIMPITSLPQIERFAELSRVRVPEAVADDLRGRGEASRVRGRGIELAAALCADLLAMGAPGLHFYTLNRSTATRDIFASLAVAA